MSANSGGTPTSGSAGQARSGLTPSPMALTRNQLTEQLLGLEVETRFISLREAKTMYAGACDDALLEAALHVPMRLAIEGEKDITVLALALGQALNALGSSPVATQSVVSLFLEKNHGPKVATVAMPEIPRKLTASEIASLRQDMTNSYHELLVLARGRSPGDSIAEAGPLIKDEQS